MYSREFLETEENTGYKKKALMANDVPYQENLSSRSGTLVMILELFWNDRSREIRKVRLKRNVWDDSCVLHEVATRITTNQKIKVWNHLALLCTTLSSASRPLVQ